MSTTAADVAEILSTLAAVGVVGRVGGGWGIDALVGQQTRPHRDLDLAVPAEDLDAVVSALVGRGFTVTTDWLPVRVELSADERHLDLHPLHFQEDGSAWQAGLDDSRFDYPADAWTTGTVGTLAVVCLTAALQRRFHSGYDPRPVDLHDLDLLGGLEARPR